MEASNRLRKGMKLGYLYWFKWRCSKCSFARADPIIVNYINKLYYLNNIMSFKGFEIDDDLWKAFRKKCVLSDTTMRKQLTKLIKDYVGDE